MVNRIYTAILAIGFTIAAVPAFAGGNDKDQDTHKPDKHKLLKLVNEARAKGCKCGDKFYGPATAVEWDNKLEMAALGHSMYMREGNYLSHTGLNGNSAGERISATGYEWHGYGENIAAGYLTEESVVNGWINSSGHCKNIMNGSFRNMAVARSGSYWTMVLAR